MRQSSRARINIIKLPNAAHVNKYNDTKHVTQSNKNYDAIRYRKSPLNFAAHNNINIVKVANIVSVLFNYIQLNLSLAYITSL